MFKLQITLDHHNLRLNLNDDLLPDPPQFSLPSTFKVNFKMDNYLKFHLSHYGTDVVNALGEGLTAPGHSDGTLRGVG
jgi:hypothetical protein